jgi:hypothetical protein
VRRALRILVPLLFVLAWAPTLTPLHRLYGFGARTALIGVIEGLLLLACAVAIFGAGKRQGSSVRIVAAAFAGWIALTVLTAAVEPTRGRSQSARHLSPAAGSDARSAAPRRVLLLCVDGLDWNAIDLLVADRQLPFLARVLSGARTYEVDNHGAGLSPGIWARAYTGAAEPIQGFAKWTLRGSDRNIAVLPQWRHRPIFMLDAALTAGAPLHLWDATSPTNADFVHAPLWRVASAARVPVGVFDPLPFDVAGEKVNGFFAWQADDGFRVAVSNTDGSSSIERIRDETSSDSYDDVIRGEAIRAGIAARAFSQVRPDIGIYYTHVLDAIGHMIWEPGAVTDAHAARAERTRRVSEGRVAAAYRAVDQAMQSLAESFGQPATIVIVSDHGWEFNEYAHRTAPMGVAIIAGAGARGYGGMMPIERVAATVLALARVAVPPAMAPPLDDVAPQWTTCTNCAAPPVTFLSPPANDIERRNRLRSLGYITK